jgi:hypothetical protein
MNKIEVLSCHVCRKELRKTMNKIEVLPCHICRGAEENHEQNTGTTMPYMPRG